MKHAKKEKKKKKKRGIWKFFKVLFLTIFILCLTAGVGVAGYTCYLYSTLEDVSVEDMYARLEKSSYIYDCKGNLIDTIYFSEDRKLIKAETIPPEAKNAFIAIEDKTFYNHHGFNFRRMFGAIYNKLTGRAESISGTSTITQQLARNIYLADTKSERTIKRKVYEMLYAFKIERSMTKDEIIEAYLNTIYLGYGCYGIDSASKTYFSKPSKDLDIAEIAILAALPQAPDAYSPLKNEETDTTVKLADGLYADSLCEERRDLVLELMYEQGYISEKEKEDASKPVEKILSPTIEEKDYTYTYFKDFLIQQVKKDLMAKYDYTEEEAESLIYTGGLQIYSTVNPDAQKAIIQEFSNDDNFPWNYGDQKTQAAMVITEVGTGKVVAMVGGRDAKGEKLFNRATNPRQPGSSIKPLAVYSAALQKSFEYAKAGKYFEFHNYGIDKQGTSGWGNYITASSLVTDEPTHINGETWPKNFTRSYSGKRNFRSAIQQSINTCAVKILYQIGVDYSSEMLQKYGISTLELSGEYNDMNPAALALGAMTYGITPLDMALAYGTFPNGGVRDDAVSYTKVVDAEGEVLLTSRINETEVLDPGVAWIMTDVLKSVVSKGIAYPAAISGVQVGGKTGTTDKAGDIWFAGFTPGYSAALWIGADDNSEMNTTSLVAARLWSRVMDQIPEVKTREYKPMPANVVRVGGEYYTSGTQPGGRAAYPAVSGIKEVEQKEDSKSHNTGNTPDDIMPEIDEPADFDDDVTGTWVTEWQNEH